MTPKNKKPAPARKAVKKPVINLKATEVKSATEKAGEKAAEKAAQNAAEKVQDTKAPKVAEKKPADKPASGASAKPTKGSQTKGSDKKKKSKKTGLILVSLAALVAAGLGGAWAFKTYGAQYLADPNAVKAEQLAEVVARVAKLEAAAAESKGNGALVADIKKQLGNNSDAMAANKKALQANAAKLATLEKTASEVRVALAKAVEDGNGPVAAANDLQFQTLTKKLAGLEKNLTTLKDAPVEDNSEELGNLKTRFDAFLIRLNAAEEQTAATSKSIGIVKTEQEKLASSPTSNPASELARAFTVLRAKISQGGSFVAELDTVAGQLPQETSLDALRPFAEAGAPTMVSLGKALGDVNVVPVPAATEQPAEKDGGMFGVLTSKFTGLVKVTKAGEADWSVLKEKAVQALNAGQLENAVGLLKESAGAPKGVEAWLQLANNKIKIDQAVKGLSEKIVTRLTAGRE